MHAMMIGGDDVEWKEKRKNMKKMNSKYENN